MEKLNYYMPKNTLYIQTEDCNLQVFRVGEAPNLTISKNREYSFKQMKSIHTHFTYEIFFITSGTLKLVTEFYTKDYQNSILIIPPKIKHFGIPVGGESYCLLFSFEKEPDWASEITKTVTESAFEIPMSEDILFYIKKLSEKSTQNTDSAERDSVNLASLIFNNVFDIIKSNAAVTRSTSERSFQNISAIEAFINENIDNKFTLTDVAESVHLSPRQITRIIEKEYGCTFSQLITEKRLAIAVAFLKNTDMKISEISSRTFYGTEAYFYTVFKKKYKVSPLQYRKNLHNPKL